MREDEYKRFMEEYEMACFRGDLATSSPESYALEEMRGISAPWTRAPTRSTPPCVPISSRCRPRSR